jgi:ketol-acid reductoisomerase
MNIYYDKDANMDLIRDKQIAVIGYGSQGYAQANNLKDSGCNVTVGLRTGSGSWEKAEHAGLKVLPVAQAAAEADLVMMLVPDELAPDIYAREVAESITPGKYLVFSHGFSIHYKFIEPPTDANVFMVAPKGPGHLVRHEYKRGAGVPCLLAISQDPTGNTKSIVCIRDRRRTRRHHRDHFSRRNRNRSLRRTGSTLRRPDLADQSRF